jgi:hypothetical protein
LQCLGFSASQSGVVLKGRFFAVFTVLFLSIPDGFPAEKHRVPGWTAPAAATG